MTQHPLLQRVFSSRSPARWCWALSLFTLGVALPCRAATVVDHDFNDGTFGPLGHGSFWSIQPAGGVGNTPAARLTYAEAGNAGKALFAQVASYVSNTFWVEVDVRIEGTMTGGSKFVKFFGKDDGGTSGASQQVNNMTLALEYSSNVNSRVAYHGDCNCADPWSGPPQYGDCGSQWLATGSSIDPRGGAWGHYKAYIKRADSGQKNGETKIWWNGVLHAHIVGQDSNPTSQGLSYGFNSIEFGGYNDARYFTSSSPTYYMWMDNIYIGTTEKNGSTVPDPQHVLTVNKNGSGNGTVFSTPAGITCGATCSHSFAENVAVSLTATPSSSSSFTSWSGCDAVTANGCTVTMTGARSVTASFTGQAAGCDAAHYWACSDGPCQAQGFHFWEGACRTIPEPTDWIGANLAANPSFSSWTGDLPDGWSSYTPATVSEDLGGCLLQADTSAAQIYRALPGARSYRYALNVRQMTDTLEVWTQAEGSAYHPATGGASRTVTGVVSASGAGEMNLYFQVPAGAGQSAVIDDVVLKELGSLPGSPPAPPSGLRLVSP